MEIPVPPTAFIGGARDTVERGNKVGCKEAGEDVAHNTANAMDGKDIEAVIDGENILVLDNVEAADRGDGTDEASDEDGDCL